VENQVSRVDYCAFEGREVQGVPETVLSRGQVVYQDGKVTGKPGHGQFIRRAEHLGTLSPQAAPPAAVRVR
jgi:dihydropyrimidinase